MARAGADTSTGTFRSLRHPNMRLYMGGLLVSNIGTWLQFTATSYLLYQLSGRATDAGLNTLFQFLPMLLLGAWAGGFA
ncbi:MAG: MFS transporter, partial [Ilumatobacteraceae bacterium]